MKAVNYKGHVLGSTSAETTQALGLKTKHAICPYRSLCKPQTSFQNNKEHSCDKPLAFLESRGLVGRDSRQSRGADSQSRGPGPSSRPLEIRLWWFVLSEFTYKRSRALLVL